MKASLAIAGTELRRFMRDRSNIFFVLIFPLLLVVVIGIQFGGDVGGGRVAMSGVDGQLKSALTDELTDAGVDVTAAEPDDMRTLVARGRADVGLFIGEDAVQAYTAGEPTQVEMITGSSGTSPAVAQHVQTALQAVSLDRIALSALGAHGVESGAATEALDAAEASTPPVELRVVDVDELAQEFSGLGRFDLGAATMVLLFVFLSTLSSSVTLIQTRRLGIQQRVLAAPVSSGEAIGGQLLGRWVIAIVQGGYIMVASTLLFNVDFGNLWLSLLLLFVFALVATGAAMLLGTVIDHEGTASGLAVGVGLVLGALGGCMFPLELFPDTLQTVAHVTPHAWGYDAFAQIQRHSGGLADIALELGVLAAMATVLIAAGSWTLRRSVARAM